MPNNRNIQKILKIEIKNDYQYSLLNIGIEFHSKFVSSDKIIYICDMTMEGTGEDSDRNIYIYIYIERERERER